MELDQLDGAHAPVGAWVTARRPLRMPPQFQTQTDPMGSAWAFGMPLLVAFLAVGAATVATAEILGNNHTHEEKTMLGMDKTGPAGTGPIGRGLGPCGGGTAGRGRGGRGYGLGGGFGQNFRSQNLTPEVEKELLKKEKIWLETQLESAKRRLEELEK